MVHGCSVDPSMPVSDEQLQLLRKQQMLVEQLKSVLATQQRTLASLGAAEDDYDNAPATEYDGCDSDNEGELDRLATDAQKAEAKTQRYEPLSDAAKDAANEDWTGAEAESEEERGFMSVKPWLGAMAKPSDWSWEASRARDDAPAVDLELNFVHGYRARGSRSNVAFVDATTIVYPVAALGVVMDTQSKQQRFFRHHDDDVLCLDYNSTKRIVATGQQGKRPTVCVWSVDDPSEPIAVFTGHKRGVVSVSISPDGTKVASVGLDDEHTVMVHDIETKAKVCEVEGDRSRILGIYWNRTAAANSATEFVTVGVKHIKFWTVSGKGASASKGLLGRKGKYQAFLDCDFTPDHTLIATECGDVYVFAGNKLKDCMHAHNGAVFCVCSDLASGVIITGGRDGFVNTWDRNTFKNTGTVNLNTVDSCSGLNSIKAMKLLPAGDASKLLLGTITSSIYELDLAQGADSLRVHMAGHHGDLSRKDSYGEMWGVAAHPTDPSLYVSCAEDSTVRVWNIATKETVVRAQFTKAHCVCYSPDGKFIGVGFDNGRVAILNALDLSEICKIRKQRRDITCVRFSPDGKYFAAGTAMRAVDLYKVDADGDLDHVSKLSGATSNVLHIDFTKDSKYLQVCTKSYELLYYDVEEAKFFPKSRDLKDAEYDTFTSILGWSVQGIWAKEADGSDINMVNKNHAGNLLVATDDDGAVRVFNYPCVGSGLDRRGKLNRRPEHVVGLGHSEHVTNAVFNADDSCIISVGGADNAVMQWKVVSKK